MRYFVDYEEWKSLGETCYFEFQKGKFKNKFWLKDSICIHMDVFEELELYHLFNSSLGTFDYYGPNDINKKQWQIIVNNAKENQQWKLVVEELTPWIEECFSSYKYFSIVGI